MKNGAAEVLDVYLLKRISERADEEVKSRRKLLQESLPDGLGEVEEDGLKVVFGSAKGRKKFDPEKAEAFFRHRLSKSEFNTHFTEYVIERKSATLPPPELLREMEMYFNIRAVARLDEQNIYRTEVPPEEVDEECYSRAEGHVRMTTPSKVSDMELLQRVRNREMDVLTMLIPGGS